VVYTSVPDYYLTLWAGGVDFVTGGGSLNVLKFEVKVICLACFGHILTLKLCLKIIANKVSEEKNWKNSDLDIKKS